MTQRSGKAAAGLALGRRPKKPRTDRVDTTTRSTARRDTALALVVSEPRNAELAARSALAVCRQLNVGNPEVRSFVAEAAAVIVGLRWENRARCDCVVVAHHDAAVLEFPNTVSYAEDVRRAHAAALAVADPLSSRRKRIVDFISAAAVIELAAQHLVGFSAVKATRNMLTIAFGRDAMYGKPNIAVVEALGLWVNPIAVFDFVGWNKSFPLPRVRCLYEDLTKAAVRATRGLPSRHIAKGRS